MLRPGGRYIEIGNISAKSMVEIDMNRVLHGIQYIVPVSFYSPQLLPAALEMLDRGLVKALAHITGDGFLNLTRVERAVGYVLDTLPPPPPPQLVAQIP